MKPVAVSASRRMTCWRCGFAAAVVAAVGFIHAAPSPEPVDEATMQRVYETVKTPHKYGIVLRGAPSEQIDCPNVFRHGDRWFMVYIAYDGRGYETRLATSGDLLTWEPVGPILPRSGQGWDAEQAAGGLALIDPRWDGNWELQTHEGRYWLSYLGGAKIGYETPPLSIGLASTENPTVARPWMREVGNPVLSPADPDARAFERDTLFKSYIFRDPDQTLGAPFVMAYNARAPKDSERIGLAISHDLKTWRRYGDAHVLENARPPGVKRRGVISGDPQIVRMGELWVMFYFGAFWKPGAFDTFAVSRDLVQWTKWTGPDLVAPSEPWDREYAHKPWLVRHQGIVYHFYCAVGDQGRVIALATSRDLRTGKLP
jgi:hypothetical protein